MKNLQRFLSWIFLVVFFSSALAVLSGLPVLMVAGVIFSVSVTMSVLSVKKPDGVALDVLTELWTGELVKNFRFVGKWLSRIGSHNEYVNNNVIHLADVGADPAVLINNTTYPIAAAQRTDADIALALKRFDTENTIITDDELYALPYDKPGSVMEQHRLVLEEKSAQYGLFSLAPAGITANTPIVETTGADRGTGRKRLRIADIVSAKEKHDNLKIPLEGRIMVLCNDHVADLLHEDQAFRDRFYNTKTGEVINFMGYEMYQDVFNPVYSAANAKKSWGAAPAGTDRNASTFFYAPRAFKAMGDVEMYYQMAKQSPRTRQSEIGFRLYHIVLPKKNVGFGAIVSDDTI